MRAARACLGALAMLCAPPVDEAATAFLTDPLGAFLAKALAEGDAAPVRAPTARLLRRLATHETALASLVGGHRASVLEAAVRWLPEPGPAESRRDFARFLWTVAQRKERALTLATPQHLVPILARIKDAADDDAIREDCCGALAAVTVHRDALARLFAFHQKSGKRRLIDEVLDVLQPTLGAAFGELHTGEEGAAPFRAALGGAANLCFVAIVCGRADGRDTQHHAHALSLIHI